MSQRVSALVKKYRQPHGGWRLGRLTVLWQCLFGGVALLILFPILNTDLIGIAIFAVLLIIKYLTGRK